MRLLFIAALMSLTAGCTVGAHGTVTANAARYPISLSQHVRGADGRVVEAARLQKVGTLRYESKSWAMLWGLIPLGDDHDLSTLVNDEVQRSGGDAVINLTVASDSCGWNSFVYFNPLHILPLWPGCVNIEVEGDIVRLREQSPVPPSPLDVGAP